MQKQRFTPVTTASPNSFHHTSKQAIPKHQENYTSWKQALTTCGPVKTSSPDIVSTDGSSNAHCLANGNIADTAE